MFVSVYVYMFIPTTCTWDLPDGHLYLPVHDWERVYVTPTWTESSAHVSVALPMHSSNYLALSGLPPNAGPAPGQAPAAHGVADDS